MKRKVKLLVFIVFILLMSGCGNDIKCKKEYDGNIKYKVTVKATVADKKIFQAKATMRFNNRTDAKHMCELNKMISNDKVSISCDDNYVYIYGYEYLEMAEGKKSISEKDFLKKMKSQGFKC